MSDVEPIPSAPPKSSTVSTGPPQLSIEHNIRISALEAERVWKLNGDTLWMCSIGQPDIAIPLTSIQEVRLSYEPSRAQTNRYRCYLYNSAGKIATIQNEHYKGIMSFEDRSKSYKSLLNLLIPRIASLSPRCIFKTGTSLLSWWAQFVMIFVVFSILLLAIIFLFTAIGWLVIVKLLVIAFFIPALVRWFMKNKPRTFDPQAIPEDMMP